ncbi:MAG: DUF3822 family protein [Bacteroidota bacterium]
MGSNLFRGSECISLQIKIFLYFYPVQSLVVVETIYSAYQHQSAQFEPEQVRNNSLRLLMRPNLLQYAVLSEAGKILAAKEYRSKIDLDYSDFFDAVYAQDYFLKEDYASIRVINGTLEFSLIPTRLFQPKQVKEFAGALIKESFEVDHLDYRNMDAGHATAIFTVPFPVKQKCDFYLEAPEYVPFCLPAINLAVALADTYPDLILVHIFAGEFVLTGLKAGNLHICNAYNYVGVTDIVYFVQLVMDTLKQDPKSTQVLAIGEFELESELLRQLRKYIPGIEVPQKALTDCFVTRSEKLPTWRYAYLTY